VVWREPIPATPVSCTTVLPGSGTRNDIRGEHATYAQLLARFGPDALAALNLMICSSSLARCPVNRIGVCNCMQLRLSSSGDTTGRLLLEQGDLAGRCYRFETSICQNPVCQCERVTLRCFPETPQPPSQASIFVCLEMDLAQQDIVNLEKLKADPTAITLAKAVAEEISEADWKRLRYYYVQTKQYWTEHADPDQIDAHFPPEVVAGNGSMVGYYEIFPYAKPVEFTVGAQTWLVDDQYCVNPNCSCQEVVLS